MNVHVQKTGGIRLGRSRPAGGGYQVSPAGALVIGGKRPSSTRKYICPRCSQSVRATKRVNILCGDCMETMVVAQ